jgi:hypothetical protein
MKSKFEGYVEYGIFVFGWFGVLSLSWLRFPLDGPPYSLSSLTIILLCILAILAPALFVKGFSLEFESSAPGKLVGWCARNPTMALILLGVSLMLYDAALRNLYSSVADYDIAEKRGLRSESVAASGWSRRVLYLSTFSSMVMVYACARAMKGKLLHGMAIGVIVAHAGYCYKLSGSRAHGFILFVYLAALLLYNAQFSLKRKGSLSLVAIGSLVGAAVINVLLSVIGLGGGASGAGVQAMTTRGQSVLVGVGVKSGAEELGLFMGFFDEYVLAPVYFLDYYLTSVDHPPALGSHTFSLVTGKFGYFGGQDIKVSVDDAYEAIGRTTNVWATGIREVCIDTGVIMLIPAFLVIGLGMCVLKRAARWSDGASFLYVMLVSWIWFSPVSSVLKSSMVELGFYLGVGWFVLDIITRDDRRWVATRGADSPSGNFFFPRDQASL